MFSAQPKLRATLTASDPLHFNNYFVQFGRFTACTSDFNLPASDVSKIREPHPKNLPQGQTSTAFSIPQITRMQMQKTRASWTQHEKPMVPMATFSPLLGEERFMGVRFCQVKALCQFFYKTIRSPLLVSRQRYGNIDAIHQPTGVFPRTTFEIEVANIHPLLQPSKDLYGLKDYEKVYSASLQKGFYEKAESIKKEGRHIIGFRPDQYVAAES